MNLRLTSFIIERCLILWMKNVVFMYDVIEEVSNDAIHID